MHMSILVNMHESRPETAAKSCGLALPQLWRFKAVVELAPIKSPYDSRPQDRCPRAPKRDHLGPEQHGIFLHEKTI